MVLWFIACGVVGLVAGYGLQKLEQRRRLSHKIAIEQENSLIDVTHHHAVLQILIAAASCPGMSMRRAEIEQILRDSGYELQNCSNGKCRPRIWRRRDFPRFVKKPVIL